MRRPRVYCPNLAAGAVALPSEESHHLRTVLRAGPGTEVILFDGKGNDADGVITSIDRRDARLEAGDLRTRPFELAIRITVAVALGKAHRQAYLVEKCTELGVEAIWPILSDRGVTKPGAAGTMRLRRRAVEAAKQSGRAWVPGIENPQSLPRCARRVVEFQSTAMADVDQSPAPRRRVGAPPGAESDAESQLEDAGESSPPRAASLPFDRFLSGLPEGSCVLVFVGPEGGWSPEERTLLRTAGATSVTLSSTTLRTETAAVAVCAAAALFSAASFSRP